MKVRIKFTKYGPVKFIGHLDTMRYFQKAIRRCNFPIHYSGGFSPHQIMSFAFPLGVGMESDGEYFDVECDELTGSDDWTVKLNEVMVPGYEITGIRILPDKTPNAMASVSEASYRIEWKGDARFSFDDAASSFKDKKECFYTKETKKGSVERDMVPNVKMLESTEKGGIRMRVSASSGDNLPPAVLLEALLSESEKGRELMGQEGYLARYFQVIREDLYTTLDDRSVSLGEIGEAV